MCILKIITTAFICILMPTILWFCKDLSWERDKASVIGFAFMETTYLLSVVCMWL